MVAFYDTFATYVGDGSTTDFPIPFPRIDDLDILVRVNDVDTAYTLVSTSMIRITPAPALDAIVRIQRQTDIANMEATFQAGSPIPATQINLDFVQLLYAAQESSDLRNVWYRTAGVPDNALGKQGDWAIDESTGDLYQKISDLVWQSTISLIGPQGTRWYSGTGAPGTGLGKVTDWYLDDANGDVYEKTGVSTWTLTDNLTGPAGPVGATGAPGADATGDVEGPESSNDNGIARYDGGSGKIIQDSLVTITDQGQLNLRLGTTLNASMNIPPASAAPASPANGDMWYENGTHKLALYIGGAVKYLNDTYTVAEVDALLADKAEAGTQPVNTQVGTTYTTVLSDAGKVVTLNNAAAITLTIPPFADVAYPDNTRLDFLSLGAGDVTITPGSGVTINSEGAKLTSAGQYAAFSLYKVGTNTWVAFGNLVA